MYNRYQLIREWSKMSLFVNFLVVYKLLFQKSILFYTHGRRHYLQGLHRLEKYLNLDGFFEKSLKIKSTLKNTGKSLESLEKSLNSTIFCRT